MIKKKQLTMLVFTASCLASLFASSALDRSQPVAIDTITSSDLKSGLYFLASDEMQGRAVNTPSNEIVAAYLAHRFDLMGLKPVQNDSYFQYFSIVRTKLAKSNRIEIRSRKPSFRYKGLLKKDFFPSIFSASGRANAPMVFAGYGVTAPEHNYDDYLGINVRGKIAVVMNHEPNGNKTNSSVDYFLDSKYNEVLYKITNAQAHHAVGLVIISNNPSDPKDKRFPDKARTVWPKNKMIQLHQLKEQVDRVHIPVVHVSSKVLEPVLRNLKTSLGKIQKEINETKQSRSFSLPRVKIRLHTEVVRNEIRVRNVLSYLPGSDPILKDEIVIVSSHFDHMGVQSGKIFNGADDDASGTVGLLEIAEAYSLQSEKPKRSILFAAWNAEELGLLGSRYYIEKPTLPLDQVVAMLQMDMIGRNEEIINSDNPRFQGLEKQRAEDNHNSLNILGYSRSEDLRQLVTSTNQHIGLDLKFRYDHHPLNLLRRSDHWPFLSKDVPALFFHTGLHPDYHQPTDTADKINYAKMEKIVRLVFLCSWALANTSTTPRFDARNISN